MAKNKQKLDQKITKKIMDFLSTHSKKSYNYKQISGGLNIKDLASKQQINTILEGLVRKSLLKEVQKGKFQINPKTVASSQPSANYIIGTVDMKSTGKAYISCDGMTEDIYISANNTNKALHGDKVKVFLFPIRKGRRTEGQIIEVLERAKSKFVGIVQLSNNLAFLIPDNHEMPIDVFIPLNQLNGALNGQKAIAEITDWPERARNPFGKILQVLGNPGDNDVEMNSILAEFDFPMSFPEEVVFEAEKISNIIPESEIKLRKDFRKTITFTIDPKDSKDFDDALSIKKLKNNNWEVGVHIADVSYYVKTNTIIEEEAFSRATSVYLVDRVIPMLPEHLSNELCSLKGGEEKLCFSAVFELDDDANIINEWFGKTIINSNRRFDYDEVQQIILSGKGEFSDEILLLNKLASKLRKDRYSKGSFAFETTEVKFNLDEKGKPISVYVKEYLDSNKLIEDFMLLANRRVAEFIGKKKDKKQAKTFVYRVHDNPNPEKLNVFSEFVGKLGYKMNIESQSSIAKSFNKLLKDISGKGEENMISNLAVRTMSKAYYSTINIGHYGLAFDYYTHFTSPIRRYPDLMVHRLLELYISGGPSVAIKEYEEKCKHSSDMEKKAAEAERASVKYKQVEFLMDKIGQVFDGLISGVSKWGIYVEIAGNKCEGMISLRDLVDDFYYLDEDNYCVTGQRTGVKYKLGDPVKIRVKRANLSRKQLDFEFV